MRLRPAGAALLTALLMLTACRGGEPDRVRLRFEYQPGETLRYSYETAGTMTFPDTASPGAQTTRSYERVVTIEEVAEEVTPRGNYRLAVTYRLPPDTAGGSPPPEPFTIRLEMTPQGRILSVAGVETARPLFGDIDFQSYFEQAQPVFPERPLRPGDSWTQEVRVMGPGAEPVSTSSTYVLESLRRERGRPIATIAFDGEIYLPLGHGAAAEGGDAGSPVLSEERIRVHGRIELDTERGVIREVDRTARVTVTRLAVQADTTATRSEITIDDHSLMRLIRP